jgi:NAD(P)-dependent dehydrogenase (short-subunit alcohol dehydrogenase family)
MGDLSNKAVVVAGADNVVGQAVVEAAAAVGGRVHAVTAIDALDPTAWDAVFSACRGRFGSVDLFVNAQSRVTARALSSTSTTDFAAEFNDVATAGWLAQKHAILALRQSGGGAIVNVISVLGRVAAPAGAALCAASRGLLMSTKSAALECARAGDKIVLNTVLAGRIDGDLAHWPDGRLLPGAPAVTPAEVAAAVIYFITGGAAYMTGAEIPVDGGFLAS